MAKTKCNKFYIASTYPDS